jgi:hypothetical protein
VKQAEQEGQQKQPGNDHEDQPVGDHSQHELSAPPSPKVQ